MLEAVARAKLNLVLRVGPRRADGYHEIATVLAQIELGDGLRIGPAARTRVRAPGLPEGDTLVTRALDLLCELAGHGGGFEVEIEKRVPAGAGLGGGSSDAGTALRLANGMLPAPLDQATLRELAAQVGSDVPFFAAGVAAAHASGRGEQLEPLDLPTGIPRFVVVAWPGVLLSTAEVYAAFNEPESLCPATLADLGANDLQAAAERLCPASGRLRRELEGAGAIAAVSGSGSAVYGLFDDAELAGRAHAALGDAAWSATTRLATRDTMQP